MRCKLPVALPLVILLHIIYRAAGEHTQRVELPCAFGTSPTLEALCFNPHHFSTHCGITSDAIYDGVADDLAEYASGLKRELPIFKVNLNDALNGLEASIDLYVTEKLGDPGQLEVISQQLAGLVSGMREGRGTLDRFRKTLAEVPGLTVKLKKSKRMVERLLDEFGVAITVFLDKAESIQLRFSK